MDLNRILLVPNVSLSFLPWQVLTVHAQTELGLNIYAAVSDVREGVTKTQTVVSDTHVVVADTHVMVSDIRRQMLGSQGEADDQRRLVSGTRSIPTTEYILTISQTQARSVNSTTNWSNVLNFHLAYPANHLRRRRGPVSDVTS